MRGLDHIATRHGAAASIRDTAVPFAIHQR
jgi:hypothetical protein